MNAAHPHGRFGPWSAGLERVEERAQLRLMGGVAASFIGCRHALIATLRKAEEDADAKAEGLRMFGILPSLTRRRIVSTFSGVMWARERAAQRARSRRRADEPEEPCARFSDLPSAAEPA
jgi:hypothetical protein